METEGDLLYSYGNLTLCLCPLQGFFHEGTFFLGGQVSDLSAQSGPSASGTTSGIVPVIGVKHSSLPV